MKQHKNWQIHAHKSKKKSIRNFHAKHDVCGKNICDLFTVIKSFRNRHKRYSRMILQVLIKVIPITTSLEEHQPMNTLILFSFGKQIDIKKAYLIEKEYYHSFSSFIYTKCGLNAETQHRRLKK